MSRFLELTYILDGSGKVLNSEHCFYLGSNAYERAGFTTSILSDVHLERPRSEINRLYYFYYTARPFSATKKEIS
jgi:hypothetical protein